MSKKQCNRIRTVELEKNTSKNLSKVCPTTNNVESGEDNAVKKVIIQYILHKTTVLFPGKTKIPN